MDHFIMLMIIAEECRNDNYVLFCFFVDFRKSFDRVPRNNLCNRLEELNVHFDMRAYTIRLYEKVIFIFKNNEGWTTYINCNILFKQCFFLSPTIFGIYIDNLERYLEEAGCVGKILARIVIILLLYAADIVLMERSPSDHNKKLRIIKKKSLTWV